MEEIKHGFEKPVEMTKEEFEKEYEVAFNSDYSPSPEPKPKANRGFAVIKARDPERLADIARKGGKAMSNSDRSFSRNRKLAREAGRKGGLAKGRKGEPTE